MNLGACHTSRPDNPQPHAVYLRRRWRVWKTPLRSQMVLKGVPESSVRRSCESHRIYRAIFGQLD